MTTLHPQGILEPLDKTITLPEALDRKAWRGNKLEFSDKEGRWCLMMTGYVHLELAINAGIVRPEEIRSFKDLLDSKWRGKIVLTDPRVVGPGQLGFTFLYHTRELGPDYIQALSKQEITLLQDHRLLATHVATGKYPIGLFPQPTQIHTVIKAGAPVRAIGSLAEGSAMATGFGSMALPSKAPHPNAARVYINWLLTREGQTLLAKGLAYASRRLDAPTDHLPAFMVPERGVSYFETDHADTLKLRAPVLALAKKVFGE
jgi:iron(III) transport system substrate-binding protein